LPVCEQIPFSLIRYPTIEISTLAKKIPIFAAFIPVVSFLEYREWNPGFTTLKLGGVRVFPRESLITNYGEKLMLKQRFIGGLAVVAALVLGVQANSFALAKKVKKQATFTVRVENISDPDGLETDGDKKYPFALSPGLFLVNKKKQYFFAEGKRADMALELQAEDGNPEMLSKKLLTRVGSTYMGIFNTPAGADKPGPLLPGNIYEFSFVGTEGMRFNFIAMYGQSNDLFYAPKVALDLFDKKGDPLNGDITDKLLLWDAGTEVNQAPGIGDEQAPRQKMANTGKAENGVVRLVEDGFTYPNTKDVLRVTITAQ
jgi:hypothetical protein